MFRWVKNVDGELEENSPLQDGGHLGVNLWREGNENARPVEPAFVGWPVVAVLIPLLRSGPFLQGQSGDEHQEHRQEDGAQDRSIQRTVRAA